MGLSVRVDPAVPDGCLVIMPAQIEVKPGEDYIAAVKRLINEKRIVLVKGLAP